MANVRMINALMVEKLALPLSAFDIALIYHVAFQKVTYMGSVFYLQIDNDWFEISEQIVQKAKRKVESGFTPDTFQLTFTFHDLPLNPNEVHTAAILTTDSYLCFKSEGCDASAAPFVLSHEKGTVRHLTGKLEGKLPNECSFDQAMIYTSSMHIDGFHHDKGLHRATSSLLDLVASRNKDSAGRGTGIVIVDVGANTGQDVQRWVEFLDKAENSDQSAIVMFEPDERALSELAATVATECRESTSCGRLHVVPMAVSSSTSKKVMYISDVSSQWSTLLNPTSMSSEKMVHTTTLDDFFFGASSVVNYWMHFCPTYSPRSAATIERNVD